VCVPLTSPIRPAGGVVERSEQAQDAVPDVVVRERLDLPGFQRQGGLRALEGLALRLLVAAQHDAVFRRVHVQADHIPELRLERLVA